jgi:exosortase E/protease (VPEID-CTERM system)
MTESTIDVSREDNVIRVGDFAARIGHPCAGLSGIAFSSLAMAGYIAFTRENLHVHRALLAIPFVALMSWSFNAVRIALLLLIGAHWSPELAADGFHSYAGWIAFTLLTGGTILAIDRISWFHKEPGTDDGKNAVPFFQDTVSALLLPFAVFLLTSLLVGALFDPPSLGYPLRVMLTGGVLLAFYRCLPKTFVPSIDPVAVGAGIGIAIVWLFALSSKEPTPLAETAPGLGATMIVVWVVFRLLGTTVLVPIVEEFFFRGYLMRRISEIPGLGRRSGPVMGVVASSVLFAIVHNALFLAFVCGVVFGLVALRRGQLFDAILAHAVANGLIGIWALVFNDWSVI